ncbi:uncharacterized protein [Parasteatoda tepidariorum]|uniref:uncharacterized protein n=1 Tax=Parasteatoda tepidariorum TaxID=114398 RepID=UPI0039BCB829
MDITSEIRRGLISGLKFKCKMCNLTEVIWTENLNENLMNSNTAAVAGIIKVGAGFANMEELFSTMNIPCMTNKTFTNENESLSQAWQLAALNEMSDAAKEEKNIAIGKGDVDLDGIPLITVTVDGCWGKRSYRTNYSSSSGVASIVGQATGKVLFLGVRNKYCCICSRATTKQVSPAKHVCYKNWSGSSSAMESDISVEGFNNSIQMHGLIYSKFIGDGDSNFFKKILDSRPYDSVTVEKIECTNHLLRNACNKLKEIVKCGKYGHHTLRKLLDDRILRFRTAVTMAVRFRKNEENANENNRIRALKEDILNVPMHIFGCHDHCASYFCKKKEEKNFIVDLKSIGLLEKVMGVVNHLADNSRSLLFKSNNNSVEQFNSIIAKFVGGKRVNYSQRGSYQTRCNAAVIKYVYKF